MSKYIVDWQEVARRYIFGYKQQESRFSFFKSVLKLDKNFHLYIHANRDKLTVEEDNNGTYLKLYFKTIR